MLINLSVSVALGADEIAGLQFMPGRISHGLGAS